MPQDSYEDQSGTSLSDRVRSLQLTAVRGERTDRSVSKLPWLLVVMLVGVSGFLGYQVYTLRTALAMRTSEVANGTEKNASTGSPDASAPVEPSLGRVALEAGGYVVPVQLVEVAPRVGGQVLELFIEEGQHVDKGDVLAILDPTEYQFEYDRARALADQAKARYDELRTSWDLEKKRAEAALREAEELRDQLRDEARRLILSGRATSEDELVKVRSRLRQAELKVEQMRQAYLLMQEPQAKRIEAAKAEWQHYLAQSNKAKYYLDNTRVLAPISGTILRKRAEVGNTVRPESFGQGLSANLCDMADLTKLEVEIDVSERDLIRVFKGQRCEIRTEAFPDRVYDGYVSRLMPMANRSKASVAVRVRIELASRDDLLRPDMRARVTFLAKTETDDGHADGRDSPSP